LTAVSKSLLTSFRSRRPLDEQVACGANRNRHREGTDREAGTVPSKLTFFGATGAICIIRCCLRAQLPVCAAFLSSIRRAFVRSI